MEANTITNEPDEGKGVKTTPSNPRTKRLALALVVVAFCVVIYQVYMSVFYLPFDPSAVRRDGAQLYVVSIGDIQPDALVVVAANIEREYPELGKVKYLTMPVPADARVDLGAGTIAPYSADEILARMGSFASGYPDTLKMMGVIEEPLYSEEVGPEMDVWGLTNEIGGNFGVVSTTKKRWEIEQRGFKPGTEDYAFQFDISLGKSCLHEFGHLMGLHHCNRRIGCPLEVISPTEAIIERGNVNCDRHKGQLNELFDYWGMEK